MAMRITTKMMQNRSLNNLNTNKILQEKLTTQLSTMKKITRPSDDPVIAIRSLKLNSSLNRVDQYYEKNCKDAESWLQLTESAIKTTTDILTDMRKYIVQAAQGHLEPADRSAILENLSNFRTEIYATGNADSDGRSIFTGFRTNTPLTFKADKTESYEITEQWTNACLDFTTFVRTGDLPSVNEGNILTKDNNDEFIKNTTEYYVKSYKVPRIRLSYDNLDYDATQVNNADAANINISFLSETELLPKTAGSNDLGVTVNTTSYSMFVSNNASSGELSITTSTGVAYSIAIPQAGQSSTPVSIGTNTQAYINADGKLVIEEMNNATPPQKYKTTTLDFEKDNNGTLTFADRYETTLTVTDKVSAAASYDSNTNTYSYAYEKVLGDENADKIVYVAETGELLLGTNIQAQLAGLPITSEIRVSYEKTQWKEGDLDPIHYFNCKRYADADPSVTNYQKDPNKWIDYNEDKLTDPDSINAQHIISYDIGNNQDIRVNTTADEVFTHSIGRDIDEVVTMLNDFITLDENYETVKGMIDSGKYDGENLEELNRKLNALETARTLAKDKVQKSCEGLMTTFDGYIDKTTLAYTDVGSRSSRLKLIDNRLSAQQTNFEELVSKNEDADVTDLAIQLKSVQLTYEAALSSISYVMKTTLLNFI